MAQSSPSVTILIPTKNRKDLLRRAISSCFAQTVPIELIVLDDGSTDGTGDMVRAEFPRTQYHYFEQSKGPCFLRNRAAKLAHGDFLVSIDDDAAFVSRQTVEQTLAEFSTPRIGAVSIPYINKQISAEVHQHAPDDREIYLTSAFAGVAHAVRKVAFMASGGYREDHFYKGEATDLCLRMLACGFVTRLGMADAVEHYASADRDSKWADLYARRNQLLSAWENVPFSKLPGRLVSATTSGLGQGRKSGRSMRMVRGLLWGYGSIVTHLLSRSAVPVGTYELFRRLSKQPQALRAIDPLLPPLSSSRRGSKGARRSI
ncbi:hypothetical protein BH10PLA1_BH10PLA1_00770 [soil metagenome]